MWIIVGRTDEDNKHLIAGFDSIEEARTNLQIINTNMYYSVDIVEFEEGSLDDINVFGIFRYVKHNGHSPIKELCTNDLTGKYLVFRCILKAEEKLKTIDKGGFWTYSIETINVI